MLRYSDNNTDLWHMAYTLVAGYCLSASWNKKHMKYDFNNRNTESKIPSTLLFLLVSNAILQMRQGNKVTPHCSETGKNLTQKMETWLK